MAPITTALLVFACVFGAALLGMWLRRVLPGHHLSAETKDTVKVAMGLVATMAALVLGLLVASAKGAYDTEKSEMTQMAARIAFLDRVLAMYGTQAAPPRELLREVVERMIVKWWPEENSQRAQLNPRAIPGEALYNAIQDLSPQTERERSLKAQSLSTAIEIGQLRWLVFEQSGSSVSLPLLVILVSWLALLFLSFGLFAPGNGTVVMSLMVAALSVSGAVFLILEFDRPFEGMMRIPSAPMKNVLATLGK